MFGSLASQAGNQLVNQLTENQNDSPVFLIMGIYTQLIRLYFLLHIKHFSKHDFACSKSSL